jgi:hypothetical protein
MRSSAAVWDDLPEQLPLGEDLLTIHDSGGIHGHCALHVDCVTTRSLSSLLSSADRHESWHAASQREPAHVLPSPLSTYIRPAFAPTHSGFTGSAISHLSRTEGGVPSQSEMKPPSLSSRCVVGNPSCSLIGPSDCTLTCPKLSSSTLLCCCFALLSQSCKICGQERFGSPLRRDRPGPTDSKGGFKCTTETTVCLPDANGLQGLASFS